MADKVVDIPGVGVVAFPDTMSDDEVSTQATKLFQGGKGQTSPAPSPRDLLANVPTDEAGNPLPKYAGQGVINRTLGGIAQGIKNPTPGTQLAMDALGFIPGTGAEPAARLAETAAATPGAAARVATSPTAIGAGIGYLHGGLPGAVTGALEGGVGGMAYGALRAFLENWRAGPPRLEAGKKILQAIKDQGTTISAKDVQGAADRVLAGEDANAVVKDLSGNVPATAAERRAALGIEKPKQADVIPFSEALKQNLPPFPAPPKANVAPEIQAVPAPTETLSASRQAFADVRNAARAIGKTPPTWEEFQKAQQSTVPGQLLPPQQERYTSEGNPQYTRPGPPLAKAPKTREAFAAVREAARQKGEVPPTWPQFLAGAY